MQTLKDVEVSTIPTEACFPTRFAGDSRQILSSIQSYGILHPPRLYVSGGKTRVLDGVERVKAAREIGLKRMLCHVYAEAHLSHQNAFLLSLELNRLSRTFNIVEKAQLIKTAHEVFIGSSIPKSFWATVEVNHNIRAVQQYRDLLKLPPMIQKYAINNGTPLPTILGFLNFKTSEIEKLAAQLFILPLNQNKLSEILSLILDVSKREERGSLAILESILPELELEFSPNHKEQKLRRLLQQRRNPHYEKRLEEFETRVKKIPVGDKTKVRPAPFFEDDYVEVTTKFYSQEDVNDFIASLKDKSWAGIIKGGG